MKPRSLAKLEKQSQLRKSQSSEGRDCNDYFASVIMDKLVDNERDMKTYETIRKDCLLARNTQAFDSAEFKFARSLLEKKEARDWKDEVEIPDSEVVKYFEEDKKATWIRIKKDEKIKKTRDLEKLKEQERIVAEKEKKMRDDDQSKLDLQDYKEMTELKRLKDTVVGVMYKNPQIFKANTIMQIVNKMKKEGADEVPLTPGGSPRRYGRDEINHYQFAKQVS